MTHPINPATGLPMVRDDIAGVDVGGNPFGMDIHHYPDPAPIPVSPPPAPSWDQGGYGGGNGWDPF